ncbi:MAG: AEC family transporter [Candidatus Firestonebacteria bacterium]
MFGVLVMILTGFLAAKKSLISQSGIGELSKIVVNISVPSLIISTMLTKYDAGVFRSSWYLPAFAFFNILILNFGLALLASKCLQLTPKRKPVFFFSASVMNYSFLTLPLAAMLYGTEGILYVIMYSIAGDILLWTFGIKIFDRKLNAFNWKNLANLNIFALFAGGVCVYLGVRLPEYIIKPFTYLGNTTVPLVMLITGGVVAGIKLQDTKKLLLDPGILTLIFLKLILTPAIVLLLSGLFEIEPLVRAVIVLEAAMPTAFMSIILSKKYGKDANYAATGALVTTILSVITIPVYLSLL